MGFIFQVLSNRKAMKSAWELVTLISNSEPKAPLSQIKVLSYREKDDWILETKYNIGKKRET